MSAVLERLKIETKQSVLHPLSRGIIKIGGPCSVDNDNLAQLSIQNALKNEMDGTRFGIFKPRSRGRDGKGERVFRGVEEAGICWMVEAARNGLIAATEIGMPDHAEKIMKEVLNVPRGEVLVWIGARNVNQWVMERTGAIIKDQPRVSLMIKNPNFANKADMLAHWLGSVEHAIEGGASPEQIVLCYRGTGRENNRGLRNVPTWSHALEMQRMTREIREVQEMELGQLRLVIDTAHMSKNPDQIVDLAKSGLQFKRYGQRANGILMEIHPNPKFSLTDPGITWEKWGDFVQETPLLQSAEGRYYD